MIDKHERRKKEDSKKERRWQIRIKCRKKEWKKEDDR